MTTTLKGFTLIEVLVVMVIISIVAMSATLMINFNQKSRVQLFAKQLVQEMQLANQEAMLQPAVIGLAFQNHAYQFFRFENNTWIHDKTLKKQRFPDNVTITLPEKLSVPQIIFSESGEITPCTLSLWLGKEKIIQVITKENGDIELHA